METIELSSLGQCKISSFSNCKRFGAEIDRNISKINFYTPPELFYAIHYKKYTQAFDFWSLGIIVFKLLTTVFPFEDVSEIKNKILDLQLDNLFTTKTFSQQKNDFIQQLLNKNPKKRLGSNSTSKDIKKADFFKEIDWQNLRHIKAPNLVNILNIYEMLKIKTFKFN